MIRILTRNEQGEVNMSLQVEHLIDSVKEPASILWIDMAAVPAETVELLLTRTFDFHPLAIDDALRESHVPKVDDWQEYLYIVLRAVSYIDGDSKELMIPELDIFLGPNYIVTYSREAIEALDRVWAVCQKDQRWINRGVGHLLYRLADEIASDAVTVVEKMQDELEALEEQLFDRADSDTLERLSTLKRNVLQLRRIVVPQRDVLNKLSRNEYPTVQVADCIFFRDVYDHLLQLDDLLEDMLILVGGAMDTYLSVVNNRMNDIMKTLTVITALFMPLAFITGFFGMNFFQAVVPLGAWTSELALVIVLVVMLLVPLAMFIWMRHRSWI